MKYLFLGIECADGGKATICSIGYVLTNEDFKILRREDIVINPQGRFNLVGRPGRPDIELAYPKSTFKKAPTFDKFYEKIKTLVENENCYVIGHAVGNDVIFLNRACARYRLAPFSFKYFDTQKMYGELFGTNRQISLEKALSALGIDESFRYHQSVEDARATMLIFKTLLEKAGVDFETYLTSTDKCTGKTENGISVWDYSPLPRRLTNDENEENVIRKGRRNHTLFLRYLNYGEPIGKLSNKLAGKTVSVSMNYETNHFKEMLTLVGMIKAAGGEYAMNTENTDIFATFDLNDDEGNPVICNRERYVREEIEKTRSVEYVTLDELLQRLEITREELENATPPDVDYLAARTYRKPIKKNEKLIFAPSPIAV